MDVEDRGGGASGRRDCDQPHHPFNPGYRPEDSQYGCRRERPDIVAACLYSADGKAFATYVRPDMKEAFTPPRPRRDESSFSSGRLRMFHTVIFNGHALGTVYLESDL